MDTSDTDLTKPLSSAPQTQRLRCPAGAALHLAPNRG